MPWSRTKEINIKSITNTLMIFLLLKSCNFHKKRPKDVFFVFVFLCLLLTHVAMVTGSDRIAWFRVSLGAMIFHMQAFCLEL